MAACRSIRAPRRWSRIGPAVRSPMAASRARPTAGGSGVRTVFSPLPTTRRTRWPCSSPRSVMLAPVASKMRRPSRPRRQTSAKSDRFGDYRAAVSSASSWRWVSPRVGDSARVLSWPAATGGRRMISNAAGPPAHLAASRVQPETESRMLTESVADRRGRLGTASRCRSAPRTASSACGRSRGHRPARSCRRPRCAGPRHLRRRALRHHRDPDHATSCDHRSWTRGKTPGRSSRQCATSIGTRRATVRPGGWHRRRPTPQLWSVPPEEPGVVGPLRQLRIDKRRCPIRGRCVVRRSAGSPAARPIGRQRPVGTRGSRCDDPDRVQVNRRW